MTQRSFDGSNASIPEGRGPSSFAKSKYGTAIIPLMHEQGYFSAMFGDDILNQAALNAGATGKQSKHPLDRMLVTLSGLEKDERFQKQHIRGCDSRGNDRVVRLFTLKEEYRHV